MGQKVASYRIGQTDPNLAIDTLPGPSRRSCRFGNRGDNVLGVLKELVAFVGQRHAIGMSLEEPPLKLPFKRLYRRGDGGL